jgi:bisphosphoglycerate-dependent phosphoglycerate mutase
MPDSSARETNSWTARLKRRIYGNTQDISMEEITADTGGGYLQRSMLSTNVAQPTLDAEKEDEISGHKRHESMDLFSGNPDETKGDLRT